MGTDILIKEPFNAAVVFNDPAKVAEIISAVKTLAETALVDADGVKADATTAEGRSIIRTVAHKITKSKTFVEAERKTYTADLVKKKRSVDNIGGEIWDGLEKLAEEIRKPLTDWENKDIARMDAHDDAIALMQGLAVMGPEPASSAIKQALAALVMLRARVWEEFVNRAVDVANTVEAQLNAALASAEKRERDAAELAALRAEQAQRAEAARAEQARQEEAERARAETERAAAIAAEAAQRAKTEAEAAARREIEKANARAEKLVKEAEEVARRAAEAAERAEQERLAAAARAAQEKQEVADRAAAAAAQAERDRVEAAAQAERDRAAAVEAERSRAAEAAAALKRQEEADRAAAAVERAAEEATEQARKSNLEHRSRINNAAKKCISEIVRTGPRPLSEEVADALAQAVVTAIARGQIPNVKIEY